MLYSKAAGEKNTRDQRARIYLTYAAMQTIRLWDSLYLFYHLLDSPQRFEGVGLQWSVRSNSACMLEL